MLFISFLLGWTDIEHYFNLKNMDEQNFQKSTNEEEGKNFKKNLDWFAKFKETKEKKTKNIKFISIIICFLLIIYETKN